MLSGPFKEGKSPWEGVVVPRVLVEGELSSAVLIRLHHSLGDGYSILFARQRIFGSKVPKAPLKPKIPGLSFGYFIKPPVKVRRLIKLR